MKTFVSIKSRIFGLVLMGFTLLPLFQALMKALSSGGGTDFLPSL
jgi:hypothetical protein